MKMTLFTCLSVAPVIAFAGQAESDARSNNLPCLT
jgi:hypothetical protein